MMLVYNRHRLHHKQSHSLSHLRHAYKVLWCRLKRKPCTICKSLFIFSPDERTLTRIYFCSGFTPFFPPSPWTEGIGTKIPHLKPPMSPTFNPQPSHTNLKVSEYRWYHHYQYYLQRSRYGGHEVINLFTPSNCFVMKHFGHNKKL